MVVWYITFHDEYYIEVSKYDLMVENILSFARNPIKIQPSESVWIVPGTLTE